MHKELQGREGMGLHTDWLQGAARQALHQQWQPRDGRGRGNGCCLLVDASIPRNLSQGRQYTQLYIVVCGWTGLGERPCDKLALYYIEKEKGKQVLAATAKTRAGPKPAEDSGDSRALAKRQRHSGDSASGSGGSGSLARSSTSLARSQMDGRADHTELMPRLGPVSAPSVAGDTAESNTRKVLKEISTSLKASHTAIRHCARLCQSARTTFNEEAETVSDARARVDALLSVMPR